MKDIMEIVAGFMALAARTAPKGKGDDFLETKILRGKEIQKLAQGMVEYGKQSGKANFDRDGENVRRSDAVLLLSLVSPKPLGLNCGACGFSQCNQLQEAYQEGTEFAGPLCAWRQLDLGIALGSAVKTASLFNADNRIMYRIGVVARQQKMIQGEIVVGVPLSATGKSIYFDR